MEPTAVAPAPEGATPASSLATSLTPRTPRQHPHPHPHHPNSHHLHPLLVVSALFAITLTCYLTYSNSLSNDFAFDDNLAIVNNKDVSASATSGFSDLWGHDLWGKDLRAVDSHRSYRPLLVSLFRLIRHNAWHGDKASTFRVVSIAVHVVASSFVYVVSRRISRSFSVALAAALLFAAHPVHVEAVAAVVNMAEAIHAVFYMAMFLIFFSTTHTDAQTPPLLLLAKVMCFAALMVAAVLFKETGLTVVGIMLAYSVLSLLRALMQRKKGTTKKWLRLHLPWVLTSGAAVLGYLFLRMAIVGRSPREMLQVLAELASQLTRRFVLRDSHAPLTALATIKSSFYLEESELIRRAENPFAFLLNNKEKLLSFMQLHARYFEVLLLPRRLCAEYAFDCIPKVDRFDDARNLTSAALYLAMLCLGLHSLRLYLFTSTHTDSADGDDEIPEPARETLLGALLFLIVPFIPASGLLLRLGTLLAERLLYVPSIGYCLLLALLLHWLSSFVVKQTAFIFGIGTRTYIHTAAHRLLFALLVVLITVAYSLKARQQNLVWKDDETLFMSSMKVCARSAKLQLQVAKILINRGDYATAKKHIALSQEIDPGFCDAGYQIALVRLFHENDIKGAMEAAADNLSCVFTNMHSWELLSKLFEQQLAQTPNNYALLELHGDVTSRGGMHAYACRKYTAATTVAFENGAHAQALSLSLKAESMVPLFANDTGTAAGAAVGSGSIEASEGVLAAQDLVCFVDALGGGIRAFIADPARANGIRGLSKKERAETARGKEILFKAMRPSCIIVDPRTARIVGGSHALSAAGALQPHVDPGFAIPYSKEAFLDSSEFQQNTARLEEYARYLSASSELFLRVANHVGEGSGSEDNRLAYLRRVPESRLLSVFLWMLLGQWHFHAGRFRQSTNSFRRAMRWGVGSLGLKIELEGHLQETATGDDMLVEPTIEVAHLLDDLLSSTQRAAAPCAVLYWLAHSRAAAVDEEEDFLRDATATKDVQAALLAFSKCRDDSVIASAFPNSAKTAPALRKEAAAQLPALEMALAFA